MKEWLKGLGKSAIDAGKAKIDDTRARLAEPALTAEEKDLFQRFRRVITYDIAGLAEWKPHCPAEETRLNRAEIRNFVANPAFGQALAYGEAKAKEIDTAKAVAAKRQADEQAAAERRVLEEKLAKVYTFFANELNPIEMPLRLIGDRVAGGDMKRIKQDFFEKATGERFKDEGDISGIGVMITLGQAAYFKAVTNRFENGLNQTIMRRTLRDFPEGERSVLRLAAMLEAMDLMTPEQLLAVRVPLIWNEGRSLVTPGDSLTKTNDRYAFTEITKKLIEAKYGSREYAAEAVQSACRAILAEGSGAREHIRATLMENLYSGTKWLKPELAAALAPNGATGSALCLGVFDDGRQMLYDRNESLATIAPPGAGKSQGLLRNLLHLNAPAVVLDVKGEMFDGSAGWRSQNVGPIYRFAPADPVGSIHFNPLDFISRDEDEAYEQSERLAELLTVEPPKGDYFDKRAIQVIRSVVLFVALTFDGAARSMDGVLDLLNGGLPQPRDWQPRKPDDRWDGIAELVIKLSMSDAPSLQRLGRALEYMPEKQREGVFDSARTALKVWESPAIARLTKVTTFAPHMLRQQRATLYLCVNLDDVKRYASVLRVLMGMSLAHLTSGKAESNAEPVTFFFDELPRLGRMDVVEAALDTARGFGVRLWLFCQNMGQLEAAYPNAKGMLGNCLARIYMNPNEDTAKWLSEHLGERHGMLDGQKKPLVEKYDLTGSDYADRAVVMLTGFDNARIRKAPAWADPTCKQRINLPIQRQMAAE